MQLSDVAVRQSKPAETPYKLFDGNGLFLLVKPNGSRLWRFKHRSQGRENLMALGAYPIISLKEARGLSDEARRILARGDDPNREKKRAQVAASLAAKATFSAVAEEYLEKRSREGASSATVKKSRWLVSLLEKDVGAIPIAQMEAYELLGALRKVEATGRLESAARALSLTGQIFRYAIATTRARQNIAADLRGALAAPRPEHYAALLEPKAVGALIRAIDAFEGQAATSFALRLAPDVFVRPGELRKAQWSEIDLETKVWRIRERIDSCADVLPEACGAFAGFREADLGKAAKAGFAATTIGACVTQRPTLRQRPVSGGADFETQAQAVNQDAHLIGLSDLPVGQRHAASSVSPFVSPHLAPVGGVRKRPAANAPPPLDPIL
jgi:hypothetical protein